MYLYTVRKFLYGHLLCVLRSLLVADDVVELLGLGLQSGPLHIHRHNRLLRSHVRGFNLQMKYGLATELYSLHAYIHT